MMMSGKQYSLDSRIDLVEAVQASQDEEEQEIIARNQDKENTGSNSGPIALNLFL